MILVDYDGRKLFIAWIKCQNTSRSFHIFLAKLLLGSDQMIILAY